MGLGEGQLVVAATLSCSKEDLPFARAHLDTEATFRTEARRKLARQREGCEVGQEGLGQGDLSCDSCDVELDARRDLEGDLVSNLAVNDDVEALGFARALMFGPEEEHSFGVTPREGNADAVDREGDEARGGGHGQGLGERIPAKASRDLMMSRREHDLWPPRVSDDRNHLPVSADV